MAKIKRKPHFTFFLEKISTGTGDPDNLAILKTTLAYEIAGS
jgi:hypothetical protein